MFGAAIAPVCHVACVLKGKICIHMSGFVDVLMFAVLQSKLNRSNDYRCLGLFLF